MGVKTRAIASFTMASILAASVGLTNFASATYDEDGNYTSTSGVTCAEAQNAINNLDESASDFGSIRNTVRIIEDCSANLVIPSGKTVLLSMYSEDENGEMIFHHLTNDGGDTITVEEGASFYYESSDTPNEYIANTTEGKAIINNHGKVHILTGTFKAENEAYTFNNFGELNVGGNNFIGTKVQNSSTGKIRIIGGTFDNAEEIKPYIVKGASLDGNNVSRQGSFEEDYLDLFKKADQLLPVGYSFTIKSDYTDYLDALESSIKSSDNSILKVTGSNDKGWKVEVVGVGNATIEYRAIYIGAALRVNSYEIAPSVSDEVKDLIANLVSRVSDALDKVQKAVEDGKTISLDLEIDNKTNATSEEKTEVAKVTGEDKVIGYYNIELALKGDGEKLTNVTDLEDEEMEVRLPANFLDDLEKVAEGYTRSYYIVRLHDGVAEKINAKIEGKELVFKSGKFSTYAVAYTDTKTSDTPIEDNKSDLDDTNKGDDNSNLNASNSSKPTTNTPDTPNTGVLAYITSDGARVTALGVLVAAVISGLVASVVITRKRQKNSK